MVIRFGPQPRSAVTSDEVHRLKEENGSLKQALAEAVLDVQRYKKSLGI